MAFLARTTISNFVLGLFSFLLIGNETNNFAIKEFFWDVGRENLYFILEKCVAKA